MNALGSRRCSINLLTAIESKCTECIYDLNVQYAVINTEKFPQLPEKPVLEEGRLKLYRIK